MYTVTFINEDGDSLTAVFNSLSIAQDFVESLDEEGIIHTGVTCHTIH